MEMETETLTDNKIILIDKHQVTIQLPIEIYLNSGVSKLIKANKNKEIHRINYRRVSKYHSRNFILQG